MTQRKAELLLAAVIAARSSSFLFSKIGIGGMGIFNLVALRYLIAFGVLALLFRKQLTEVRPGTVLRSAALGGLFFAVMTAELTGLKDTGSSTTAFLESTAVAFVPVFNALLHRRLPKSGVLLSSFVALTGIFFLTLKNGLAGFGRGEAWSLLAAVLYAAYVLTADRVSGGDDVLQIGILQNGFLGVFGTAAAFFAETPHLPVSGTEWGCVLGLAIVCSAFGLTLQPVAQSGTTAERAGLFIAIAPVTSAVLGGVVLEERLGAAGLIGGALIVLSIFLPKGLRCFRMRVLKKNVGFAIIYEKKCILRTDSGRGL